MAEKIDVSLPEGVTIGGGWQIVFAAVDPTTGADVAGVVVSNANIVASDESPLTVASGGTHEPIGPYLLIPGTNG